VHGIGRHILCATKLKCCNFGTICRNFPKRRSVPAGSVSIVITPKQWKQYWKVVNKETSLSESRIHFGHYIVGSKSDIISHYHAARVTVTLAHAIQLERWSSGLSVMLEKTLGMTLVTKLQAIFLMEGGFNAANKIVYMGHGCLIMFGSIN
jgi:hypothetical protein